MAEKTYAETVAERYGGSEVELYMGNSLGNQLYAEYESSDNAIIDCVIKGAEGETLIIECTVNSVTVEVLLHGWAVEAVMKKGSGASLSHIINMPERRKHKRQ